MLFSAPLDNDVTKDTISLVYTSLHIWHKVQEMLLLPGLYKLEKITIMMRFNAILANDSFYFLFLHLLVYIPMEICEKIDYETSHCCMQVLKFLTLSSPHKETSGNRSFLSVFRQIN